MGKRLIGMQSFIVGQIQSINAVWNDLFGNVIEFMTYGYGFKTALELICQRSAFGQQFEAHFSHMAVFNFTINKYVIHVKSFSVTSNRWYGLLSTLSSCFQFQNPKLKSLLSLWPEAPHFQWILLL